MRYVFISGITSILCIWESPYSCAVEIHLFSLPYYSFLWKAVIYLFYCWWALDCFQFGTKVDGMILVFEAELRFTSFICIYSAMPFFFFFSPHILMQRKINKVETFKELHLFYFKWKKKNWLNSVHLNHSLFFFSWNILEHEIFVISSAFNSLQTSVPKEVT